MRQCYESISCDNGRYGADMTRHFASACGIASMKYISRAKLRPPHLSRGIDDKPAASMIISVMINDALGWLKWRKEKSISLFSLQSSPMYPCCTSYLPGIALIMMKLTTERSHGDATIFSTRNGSSLICAIDHVIYYKIEEIDNICKHTWYRRETLASQLKEINWFLCYQEWRGIGNESQERPLALIGSRALCAISCSNDGNNHERSEGEAIQYLSKASKTSISKINQAEMKPNVHKYRRPAVYYHEYWWREILLRYTREVKYLQTAAH